MTDNRRPFVTIRIDEEWQFPLEGEEDGVGGIFYEGAPKGWTPALIVEEIHKQCPTTRDLINDWCCDPLVEVSVHYPNADSPTGFITETRTLFR